MAKIIDFVAEAALRGNHKPLELLTRHAEDHAVDEYEQSIDVPPPSKNEKMKELSDVHRLAGFTSRRAYFWHLSRMYQVDVNVIEHWGVELGTENDFTLLIEKLHKLSPWMDPNPWMHDPEF